ncbi:MAG: hypothetical protein FJX54_05280 [Alphaproteobacteria bacterium]|nr:hypothetical protein [Alphaproteobacteria bacterium]
MPTNFEVHTLKGGVWQIDSTYQTREPAIETAKQLYGEKRFEAIKVIKDDFDPKTNKGKEIVIYDTAKPQTERKAPPPQETKAAAVPDKKPDVEFKGTGAPKAPAKSSSLVMPIILLGVLLLGGLGALFGLSQLTAFLGRL